mgnify:CR=1 FL=1
MKKNYPGHIHISDFDYSLPDEKIAKYPLPVRDSSKLLVYNNSKINTKQFDQLPDLLPKDSLILFNNTRVIHARLILRKESGAVIEVFCLSPYEPSDYTQNLQKQGSCAWKCMIGNSRRWKNGKLSLDIDVGGQNINLNAEKLEDKSFTNIDGDVIITFSWNGEITFSEILESAGQLPIPPYLNRKAEKGDDETYQTIYSNSEGSVAAPTAGLHFTTELMSQLKLRKIKTAQVTLHVGAGTFKPVKSLTLSGHEMHTEHFSIDIETLKTIINHRGKLVVVGTTTLRTLESLYFIGSKILANPNIDGKKLIVGQWEPYETETNADSKKALLAIIDYIDKMNAQKLICATQIMIAPGYKFRYADALITNFHQPRSTLLLLVSAFVNGNWRSIYDYALSNKYRFLSYGDSSLLWRNSK